MSGYVKPKNHVHREFLYLNHETIINSLSALEAGKVDEIIKKANEAREGGLSGGVTAGPANVTGGKKKASNIEEEMVITRTVFSAFDAWYKYLEAANAIGRINSWDLETRNDLEVGDTVEFGARIILSPVHLLIRSFLSYATLADTPGSLFHQKGEELRETKANARIMLNMLGGSDAPSHLPVYLEPYGIASPRIISRLEEGYLVSPKEAITGNYRIIGQVDELLSEGEEVSAIRIMRDVPPTPMEISTVSEALSNFIEPSKELGIEMKEEDLSLPAPAIVLRPIAIYR